MPDLSPTRKQRADAEQSVAAVLDAAVTLLGERPEASMAEIAAAANVSRQTVYAHYRSREALLEAVAARALAEAVEAVDAADIAAGAPAEALDRLTANWWKTVAHHARVLDALAATENAGADPHAFHGPILERLERLARRGQRSGDFARGVSPAWLAAAFLGLVHVAAAEVAGGRMSERAAARSLAVSTRRVFGAREGGQPLEGPTCGDS